MRCHLTGRQNDKVCAVLSWILRDKMDVVVTRTYAKATEISSPDQTVWLFSYNLTNQFFSLFRG